MGNSFCYKVLCILVCLLPGLYVGAFEVDGINYSTLSTGAVVSSGNGNYSGDIVIPETVTNDGRTYNVVGISNLAFKDCVSLTSVSLPETVVNIGMYAFSGCKNLVSINIPSGVTVIKDRTFYDCNSLACIELPTGLTSIGTLAFFGCETLTSLNIPAAVTSIGEMAFAECKALRTIDVNPANQYYHTENSVLFNADYSELMLYPCAMGGKQYNVPGTVTAIAPKAFSYASELQNIYVPGSVAVVGNEAFRYSSIKTVVFDEGVELIGDYAFANDMYLNSIYLPTTLTSIGGSAFRETNRLKEVVYLVDSALTITSDVFESVVRARTSKPKLYVPQGAEGNFTSAGWSTSTFSLANVTPLQVGNEYKVDSLYYTPLDTAYNLQIKKVYTKTLHDAGIPVKLLVNANLCTVTQVASSAFAYCNNITSVNIPGTVTRLYDMAFYNCASLGKVILNEGLTTVGNFAFSSCDRLTRVRIPASVTSIANKAFNKSLSLSRIDVDENNTKFTSIDGVLFSKDRKKLVTYPHNHGMVYEVPLGVTSIETNAFLSTPVTDVVLPATLQTINSMAFSDASQLRSIVVPEGVTKLNTSCFLNCSSLESIDLPSTLTSLANEVFKGDDSLVLINIHAPEPPVCSTTNMIGPFTLNLFANATVIVPARSKVKYVTDPVWSLFVNIEENVLLGDVNGDGVVNSADLTALIDYLLDFDTPINRDNADCNQDGIITPADISKLGDMLLGLVDLANTNENPEQEQ